MLSPVTPRYPQAEALTGRVLAGLADHHTVQWRVEAVTGAKTADALERLDALPNEGFDVAVTSLGVNDVTGGTRLGTWLATPGLEELVENRQGPPQSK